MQMTHGLKKVYICLFCETLLLTIEQGGDAQTMVQYQIHLATRPRSWPKLLLPPVHGHNVPDDDAHSDMEVDPQEEAEIWKDGDDHEGEGQKSVELGDDTWEQEVEDFSQEVLSEAQRQGREVVMDDDENVVEKQDQERSEGSQPDSPVQGGGEKGALNVEEDDVMGFEHEGKRRSEGENDSMGELSTYEGHGKEY